MGNGKGREGWLSSVVTRFLLPDGQSERWDWFDQVYSWQQYTPGPVTYHTVRPGCYSCYDRADQGILENKVLCPVVRSAHCM